MSSLHSLTDGDFYTYLVENKIYLQHYHNVNMDGFFKDIKWYWNKDTEFIKGSTTVIREKVLNSYKNVDDWVMYCGGRNSGLWIPSWS